MTLRTKLFLLASSLLLIGCVKKMRSDVDKALVDQVVSEFAVERFTWYLRGGEPKTNREILDKVLERHNVRFGVFAPAFERFDGAVFNRVLGTLPAAQKIPRTPRRSF